MVAAQTTIAVVVTVAATLETASAVDVIVRVRVPVVAANKAEVATGTTIVAVVTRTVAEVATTKTTVVVNVPAVWFHVAVVAARTITLVRLPIKLLLR